MFKSNLTEEQLKARAEYRFNELYSKLSLKQREYYARIENTTYRNLYLEGCAGSRPKAIKFNCLECVNFSTQRVRDCDIENCVFWNMRPYQQKK